MHSKHPNIVAAKEACGDFSRILQTMHLCGGDLDVYSGNDDQIVPILSLGGKGRDFRARQYHAAADT